MKNIKNILYYSILTGLFAVPFIAFIVPTDMFFPFITGKGFTFRVLVEIIFGLYVILAFYSPEFRPKDTWLTRSVLGFTGVMFLADIMGMNPGKSLWSNYERMEGFVTIFHLVLYYFAATSVLNSYKSWKRFFTVSIFASLLMSFYGLLQIAGKITINQGGVRVDATFGNATYLAIYLVFHIFLCLYLISGNLTKKWEKYTLGAVALLELVVLYYTATRGAILGLIGGLLIFGIYILWKERQNAFLRKISFGLIGVLAVLIIVFIGIKNTNFVKSSPVLSRFSTLGISEIKNQGRYYVWPMAIEGFKERPILGWGQDGFNYVFNKNYNPQMFGQEEWFDRTHNIFLDWLIAGGILGFLAYFSMYFALIYYVLRKDSQFNNMEKGAIIGLISAYLFHNIFVFDNLISYIMFFSVLAFVNSVSSGIKPERIFYKKVFSGEVLNYAVFPTILVVTLGAIYFVNVPAISANKALIQAMMPQSDLSKNLDLFKKAYSYNSFGFDEITEQLVSNATSVYGSGAAQNIKNDFVALAEQKIKEKIERTPHDARYLVFAGSFYNRLGRYNEAMDYLNKALAESPNKQTIIFEIGTTYIGQGNLTKAFEMFKKAYDLKPSHPESLNIYALGAIYTKNTTVLNELLPKINRNTIINDNRFLKAYSDVGDYNMAVVILTERLKADPKNIQNNLTIANVYAIIGQKQKAIDILRQLQNDNPQYKDELEGYIKQLQA